MIWGCQYVRLYDVKEICEYCYVNMCHVGAMCGVWVCDISNERMSDICR